MITLLWITQKGNYLLLLRKENLYTNELPNPDHSSKAFPIKEIKPLIEVSDSNFRGEQGIVIATLLNDLYTDFGFEARTLFEIFKNTGDYPLEAFFWQCAYTNTSIGRRRYKPTSEGFTLKVKRNILNEYLTSNNMVLCFDVKLERTTTKFVPESDMDWYIYSNILEITD